MSIVVFFSVALVLLLHVNRGGVVARAWTLKLMSGVGWQVYLWILNLPYPGVRVRIYSRGVGFWPLHLCLDNCFERTMVVLKGTIVSTCSLIGSCQGPCWLFTLVLVFLCHWPCWWLLYLFLNSCSRRIIVVLLGTVVVLSEPDMSACFLVGMCRG